MNKAVRIFFFLIVAAAFLLPVSGCMPLRPATDPMMDEKAMTLSRETASFNHHITAGRGKGWVRLVTPTETHRYRMIWAAVHPLKLRITFLMSGHPVETIVSTGEAVRFFSHTGKHTPHTLDARDPDMKDYLGVPIHLSELVTVLLGHFPINSFHEAYFAPDDPSLSTIILRKKSGRKNQRLEFDGRKNLVRIITSDTFGNPLYEVQPLLHPLLVGSRIPSELTIRDMTGRVLTLEITDFEVNPPIKETVFQLTDKGS